jgi:Cupin-like domain
MNLNKKRHHTNEYGFAHFSQITEKTKWLFPEFMLAKPIELTLNKGEALWIPGGWWHWVQSDPGTIALNYWDSGKFGTNVPYIFNINSDGLLEKIDDVFKTSNIDEVWDTGDSKCLITLPGYNEKINNKNIKEGIKPLLKEYPLPVWKDNDDIDMNLWVAYNKHDTGLHYDDGDGVLRVLRGKKRILLYPPEQSHFLAPYCIIPEWAKQKPTIMGYNVNKYIGDLDPKTNLPSARLLYETIENKNVLLEITNRKRDGQSYIWGCKWHNNVMRWELYTYTLHSNPIIVSTDLFDTKNPVGPITHKYYSLKLGQSFPYEGYGTMGEPEEPESKFIVDFTHKFNGEHLKRIGISDMSLIYLFRKYPCEQICVFNKQSDEIFVQYYNISIDNFIHFLIENKWPSKFISYVMSNKELYKNIRHEITIVYNIKTRAHVRTAFYGNV